MHIMSIKLTLYLHMHPKISMQKVPTLVIDTMSCVNIVTKCITMHNLLA